MPDEDQRERFRVTRDEPEPATPGPVEVDRELLAENRRKVRDLMAREKAAREEKA